MKNRRKIIIPLALLIIVGTTIASSSKFENTRAVDMALIVAFGLLLGVLIANVKANFIKK